MSVSYFIVPEREIEGFDPFVDGKALGHCDEDALNDLCEELEVPSLLDFFSQDPADIDELIDDDELEEDEDDTDEAAEDPLEPHWYDAGEGLLTVRALAKHLAEYPQALEDSAAILEDLQEFIRVLERLEQEKIRWYLALDY